jgi:serine/threonine-protein kinase
MQDGPDVDLAHPEAAVMLRLPNAAESSEERAAPNPRVNAAEADAERPAGGAAPAAASAEDAPVESEAAGGAAPAAASAEDASVEGEAPGAPVEPSPGAAPEVAAPSAERVADLRLAESASPIVSGDFAAPAVATEIDEADISGVAADTAAEALSAPLPPPTRERLRGRRDRASAAYPPGTLVAGKYRIDAFIARGGMGHVHLATQLPLGRRVALKIVTQQPGDAAFRERFFLEASTCARLTHANVVVVYDYGETEQGDLFTVMEYLGSRSLARTLKTEGRIEPLRACGLAFQIGRALRVAHRAGVVHRDLKPSNVMLLENPDDGSELDLVKVLDFGLAQVLQEPGAQEERLTRAGMLLGSPRYMSPEQVRGRAVDPRSDIYAFGVILFQMLTGRPPFDSKHPNEILAQHLRDVPPKLSDVVEDADMPPQLQSVVSRCLQKMPGARYQRMSDLLDELRQVMWTLGEQTSDARALLASAVHAGVSSSASLVAPHPSADRAPEPSSPGSAPLPAPAAGSPWWAAALVLLALVTTLAFWAVQLS